MHVAFSFFPISGTVNLLTVGSCMISNQFIAGSIMLRHSKLILVLSLPLRVYCFYEAINAHPGVIMTSVDSKWPYFWLSLVFGKICKNWVMTRWYCAYLSSTSKRSIYLLAGSFAVSYVQSFQSHKPLLQIYNFCFLPQPWRWVALTPTMVCDMRTPQISASLSPPY